MASCKQDSATYNMMCLLREWDRAPKEKRRRFLRDFIDQHWNRSGPELESELAQMASLFLARICVWIKLTWVYIFTLVAKWCRGGEITPRFHNLTNLFRHLSHCYFALISFSNINVIEPYDFNLFPSPIILCVFILARYPRVHGLYMLLGKTLLWIWQQNLSGLLAAMADWKRKINFTHSVQKGQTFCIFE